MDTAFLVVAIILVALVGYMAYTKNQRDQRMFSALYKPADERLLSEETQLDDNGAIAFAGEAAFTTQPFYMPTGDYKLTYWFPEAVSVKVELLSVDGSDSEIIAIKSGEGEAGFSVDRAGRYFCKIEPAKNGEWEIEINRLGSSSSGR